jgi:hypothetical protein
MCDEVRRVHRSLRVSTGLHGSGTWLDMCDEVRRVYRSLQVYGVRVSTGLYEFGTWLDMCKEVRRVASHFVLHVEEPTGA